MSERKHHLSHGILIGMGMMLIISGFFGWITNNYLFGTLSSVLEYFGIDTNRHFIMKELNELMLLYGSLIAIGFVSLLLGVVMHAYNLRLHGMKGLVVASGIIVFMLGLQIGIRALDGNTLPYALIVSVVGIVLILWGMSSTREKK